MNIRYTGFADEAAPDIEGQIEATKKLGWDSIESRNIDGVNLTDISEEAFDKVEEALAASGVRIDCFGTAIANWGKDPRSDEDAQRSEQELRRALPRMKRLGCTLLRGMSYGLVKGFDPEDSRWLAMVVDRLRPLVRACEEAGVMYLHENCMNYGGQSPDHTLRLLEAIHSPAFTLVFDTGNPPFSFDRRGKEPWKLQSALEFYRSVKPFIRHIHIKDAVYLGPSEGIFPKTRFTLPGEGNGEVREILREVLASGYSGFLSIEPHTDTVYHGETGLSPREARMASYVAYGQALERLVDEVSGKADAAETGRRGPGEGPSGRLV